MTTLEILRLDSTSALKKSPSNNSAFNTRFSNDLNSSKSKSIIFKHFLVIFQSDIPIIRI